MTFAPWATAQRMPVTSSSMDSEPSGAAIFTPRIEVLYPAPAMPTPLPVSAAATPATKVPCPTVSVMVAPAVVGVVPSDDLGRQVGVGGVDAGVENGDADAGRSVLCRPRGRGVDGTEVPGLPGIARVVRDVEQVPRDRGLDRGDAGRGLEVGGGGGLAAGRNLHGEGPRLRRGVAQVDDRRDRVVGHGGDRSGGRDVRDDHRGAGAGGALRGDGRVDRSVTRRRGRVGRRRCGCRRRGGAGRRGDRIGDRGSDHEQDSGSRHGGRGRAHAVDGHASPPTRTGARPRGSSASPPDDRHASCPTRQCQRTGPYCPPDRYAAVDHRSLRSDPN